jgi:3-phenylpropionate/trans-cinnamate dioxygenase ferredoxin subunit
MGLRLQPHAERKPNRYVVARAADIPDGERLIVEAGGRSVGIFNVGGRFYALLNRCPHQGAALCEGEVLGLLESDRPGEFHFDAEIRLISCPWHGWEYELETGQSWHNPERTRVRPYPVEVETGENVAAALADGRASRGRTRGPYRAEVLPVTVEDDYLVVSMPG